MHSRVRVHWYTRVSVPKPGVRHDGGLRGRDRHLRVNRPVSFRRRNRVPRTGRNETGSKGTGPSAHRDHITEGLEEKPLWLGDPGFVEVSPWTYRGTRDPYRRLSHPRGDPTPVGRGRQSVGSWSRKTDTRDPCVDGDGLTRDGRDGRRRSTCLDSRSLARDTGR